MLSQQLSTASSNKVEIPASQVTELYKIAKQNDYLKARAKSSELALEKAENTIKSQDVLIGKKDEALKSLKELLDGKQKEYFAELEIKNIQIDKLNFDIEEIKKSNKKQNRKKFWNGFAIGGVTVGIIGTATAIYLITK